MEGLRGIAVLLVFLVHYVTSFEPWLARGSTVAAFAEALRDLGHTGVDLFFALSGFLIWRIVVEREFHFVPYVLRRVRRIYPTYLCVLAVYVVLAWADPARGKLPQGWLATLRYLFENLMLLPGILEIRPFVTVAWSLSYEFCFYLGLPLLVAATGARRWPSGLRSVLLLGLAALALGLFANAGPIRLAMFLPGALVAESFARRGPAHGARHGLGVAALILGLLGVAASRILHQSLVVRFVLLGVALFVCLRDVLGVPGLAARIFAWAPLRRLGNMSYSYYLVHGLALKAAFVALEFARLPLDESELWFFALLIPGFLVTLPPALLLFRCVERPFSLSAVHEKSPRWMRGAKVSR